VGDTALRAAAPDFLAEVSRLLRSARRDLVIKRVAAGTFFGLIPALALAFLAGTVPLPAPAPLLAAGSLAAGAAAGALAGLLSRTDRMRLLMRADSVLGSRELASTALELSTTPSADAGPFAAAVLEDASRLLAAARPRVILGRLRLPLLPFTAVLALLTIGALLFPVDLRSLFTPPVGDNQMARIGEDLQQGGERLAETAQALGLGRSIDLSRQLAQLGRDIEARKVTPKEALERMAEIESGLRQEYGLRVQEVQPAPSGTPGQGQGGEGSSAGQGHDQGSRDLADTIERLKRAQRELGGQDAGGGKGQPGARTHPEGAQGDQAQTNQGGQAPGGQAQSGQGQDQAGKSKGPGAAGQGAESGNGPADSNESGIGTLPAPEKRGPATPIVPGDRGPALQAQGNAANDESSKMLVRSLPEWAGSRLPEQTILNQYSRQAESALAHDQVPLKLRQAVKEYFTTIGITK
jgi:hypothetical protein